MITINYYSDLEVSLPISEIADRLEKRGNVFVPIGIVNWQEFTYKPECVFRIAQLRDGLFLHFKVKELDIRTEVMVDNGPVYTDSCVEFFIDPSGDGTYYNFEWNSNGVLLLGFGNSRINREMAGSEVMSGVFRSPVKNMHADYNNERKEWELLVTIPFTAFFRHTVTSLTSKIAKGNFYKCGDKTKRPHYLTWNPINTLKPDFHRPEYFGDLFFE